MIGILAPERVLTKRFLRRYKFKREVILGGLSVYRSSQVDCVISSLSGANPSDNKPAVALLLKEYGVRFVVCLGFAYSVDQTMAVGDVVFCETIYETTGPMALWSRGKARKTDTEANINLYTLFKNMNESGGRYRFGSLLATANPVSNSRMKRWVSEEFGVNLLCLREDLVVNECKDAGIPYAVIKGITNYNHIDTVHAGSEIWYSLKVVIRPHRWVGFYVRSMRRRKAEKALGSLLMRLVLVDPN